MAIPHCAVCGKLADLNCHHCNSAWYCSTMCRVKDAPLHNLLCDAIKTFEISRPRLKEYRDESLAGIATSTYKLGLMFPKSSKLPKLLWVRVRRVYESGSESQKPTSGNPGSSDRSAREEYKGNTKGKDKVYKQTHWECGVDHLIKGTKYSSEAAIWEGGMIEILFDEDVDDPQPEGQSSPFNACLSFLMRGHEEVSAEDEIREAASSWGGNVIVLNMLDPDREIETKLTPKVEKVEGHLPEKYQDITLNNLRAAVNIFCLAASFYPIANSSPYLILEAPLWVKAVRIHCRDDEELHKSPKYRPIWHQLAELEDPGTDDGLKRYRSEIARHIGMPLVIISSLSNSEWVSVGEEHVPAGWANREALDLLAGANPKYMRAWNKPRINKSRIFRPLKCQFRLGTVSVYRKDLKEITAQQVETLTTYCSDVLRVAMKECGDHHKEEARQEIVGQHMNATIFLEYFEQLKADKVASGDTSWVDASPPYFAGIESTGSTTENERPQSLGTVKMENSATQALEIEPVVEQTPVQPRRRSKRLLAREGKA